VSCCSRRVPSSVVPLCHSRVNVVMFSRPRGFVRVHVYALRSAHARARLYVSSRAHRVRAATRRWKSSRDDSSILLLPFADHSGIRWRRIAKRKSNGSANKNRETRALAYSVCRSREKKDTPKGKNIKRKKKKRKRDRPRRPLEFRATRRRFGRGSGRGGGGGRCESRTSCPPSHRSPNPRYVGDDFTWRIARPCTPPRRLPLVFLIFFLLFLFSRIDRWPNR